MFVSVASEDGVRHPGHNVVSHSQTLTPSRRVSGTLHIILCEWFWPAPKLECKISGCVPQCTPSHKVKYDSMLLNLFMQVVV